MDFLTAVLQNKIFIASSSSWLIAQVLKTIIHLIVNREFRAERLVGAGGMPSCHSATVCALATASGLVCGGDSPVFAVSVMFAIVVMYDAMGVRRETGRQAVAINNLVEYFKTMGTATSGMSSQEKLKEFVGHSPMQVLVGATLGIVVALVECLVLWT